MVLAACRNLAACPLPQPAGLPTAALDVSQHNPQHTAVHAQEATTSSCRELLLTIENKRQNEHTCSKPGGGIDTSTLWQSSSSLCPLQGGRRRSSPLPPPSNASRSAAYELGGTHRARGAAGRIAGLTSAPASAASQGLHAHRRQPAAARCGRCWPGHAAAGGCIRRRPRAAAALAAGPLHLGALAAGALAESAPHGRWSVCRQS